MTLLAALLLAACATPYSRDTGYGGYQDGPVEKNLYRVAFTDSGGMKDEEVRDLALYRAAQVCRDHGKAWFVVVRRNEGTTRRLQVGAPEPPVFYPNPYVAGPRTSWTSQPGWYSGIPESYAAPARYTELYIRVYSTRAAAAEAAPQESSVHAADEVLSRVGAQYKLSP